MSRFAKKLAVALAALAIATPALAGLVQTPYAQKVVAWHEIGKSVMSRYDFTPAVSDSLIRNALAWTQAHCGGVPDHLSDEVSAFGEIQMSPELARAARELIGGYVLSELERWPSEGFCRFAREMTVR